MMSSKIMMKKMNINTLIEQTKNAISKSLNKKMEEEWLYGLPKINVSMVSNEDIIHAFDKKIYFVYPNFEDFISKLISLGDNDNMYIDQLCYSVDQHIENDFNLGEISADEYERHEYRLCSKENNLVEVDMTLNADTGALTLSIDLKCVLIKSSLEKDI